MPIGIVLLSASAVVPPRLLCVWNLTASAPLGPFRVARADHLQRGDLVIASLNRRWQNYAVQRHYLAKHVPLVKYVEALPGDRLCARGTMFQINGKMAARRQQVDGAGRPLPAWQGCRRVGVSEVLLLNAGHPDSFDGRYFGPTPRANILGRAVRL